VTTQTLGEAEHLAARYDEAGQIEALLRECGQTMAADLVAARLGGMRDALAVLGVDIEAEDVPEPANDETGAEKPTKGEGEAPPALGLDALKPPRKRVYSAEALEKMRRQAERMRAAKREKA
jgi:hypothetical protein